MSNNFTILSAILLITGVYLFNRANPAKVTMGMFFVMTFMSMLLFIAYGVANYFTGNGIDEATMYHLKYGLDGAGFLEYSWIIIAAITLLILGLGSLYLFLQNILKSEEERDSHIINSLSSFSLLFISLLLNPASINLYNLQKNGSIATEQLNDKIQASYNQHYRTPYIKSSGNSNKNIIFIYAESLERTYFDQTVFPDLIKGLRELESKSTYFTNIKEVVGTGWTIAGMTASQCGIPLFTPSHGNSMSGMDRFLPSAVCLGDLLNEKGYHLSYMGGASLDFAGKGKLFESHGFADILGRDELSSKLENKAYKTGWGLYDDSLLNMIYSRFIELSEAGGKFGLFTLTLDTHHPNGHPSESCKGIQYEDGSNPMLNAVACSDYLISRFIKKISESRYSNNTIVVLVSDHLAMRNSAYDRLQKEERRNLFMIIDPRTNISKEIKTVGSTLDIGPTLLPFLGYAGEIGLGRNLLNSEALEEDRLSIHRNLKQWRKPITAFWDFPEILNYLEINIDGRSIRIDDRSFRIPILIELNKRLESTLKFGFDKSTSHKSLIQLRKELDENRYFLLITECKNARDLDKMLGEKGFCLLAGQGRKYTKIAKLDKNVTHTANEIRQLLNSSNGFIAHRVAHAGGGINGKTYTNSFEALDANIQNGFQYFELDFSFTKDERLVCLHDWEHSFKRSFGFETDEKVTLKEFNALVKNKSEFHKCTADSLAEWMKENPAAYIVTDVKENNIEALMVMLQILPNAKVRVIPQVYDPVNLEAIKDLGFEKIIWTLYKFSGDNDEVLDWVEKFHTSMAVTMPKSRAQSTLPKELEERGIPSYVHTINTRQEEEKYIDKFGITELYTDFLLP